MCHAHARSDRSDGMAVSVSVLGHSLSIAFAGALHAAGIKSIHPSQYSALAIRSSLGPNEPLSVLQFSKKKKC